jgi:hypothetical protein
MSGKKILLNKKIGFLSIVLGREGGRKVSLPVRRR